MDLRGLHDFARKNWVPILRDKSADFLCKIISDEKPKQILEIGTCIGYSGILMLENSPESFLTTIEKEEERAKQARINFEEAGYADRVKVINEDAEITINRLNLERKKFDFIFLDGPKGQYVKYLPVLKSLLTEKGILFADDIFYHGLVKEGYPKHKHRTIVFRLREFIERITTDPDLETEIFDIEDGISVSVRK